MSSFLIVWLFAQSLVAAMALVPHLWSVADTVELFVFSAVPTLIAVGLQWRCTRDKPTPRGQRARIGAAFLGGAAHAFLTPALGS